MDPRLVKPLYTLSPLEEKRIKPANADPRDIADFSSIETVIAHSLRAPNLTHTQTPLGTRLQSPVRANRSFGDEELLKKLIQYRQPLSARILRPKEDESSS
jgi:hypothetical protein